MEQYTLNQIVYHCERCDSCAKLAKQLIDVQGDQGLDVREFELLDEKIATCPNVVIEN